jgi:hypothetical protein
MIGAVLAAALANSVTAPAGLWAWAEWGATRPNIELQIQNKSHVEASLVDAHCKAFDSEGAVVAEPVANITGLVPGEIAHTWAVADGPPGAVRFACAITVDRWYAPRGSHPAETTTAKPAAAKPAARKPMVPKEAGLAAPAASGPNAAPSHAAPKPAAPSKEAASHEAPSHETPSHETPSHETPSHETPSHDTGTDSGQ